MIAHMEINLYTVQLVYNHVCSSKVWIYCKQFVITIPDYTKNNKF